MIDAPNALFRRGDGLYEPFHVPWDGLYPPERVVLSIEIEPGHVPIGAPLPEKLITHVRTARIVHWWASWHPDPTQFWERPCYSEVFS